ncbi:VOC family protein [soil metagenome]
MPDPNDPTEAPFDALRLPIAPLAPRSGFATELRRTVEAALSPTDPPTTATQETTMSTTEMSTTDVPPTGQTLTPYLAVAGAAAAIDWYTDVLGAIETTRFVGDDGRIGHAEVVIGAARVMLADEFPEMDVLGPLSRGGHSVMLHLEVVDVDHTYRRAVHAGASGLRPPDDQGHGNRNATITDPFGHRWMLSEPIDAERTAAVEAEQGPGGDGSTWEVAGRQPVEPGYFAIRTGDLERARAFYGALFAWDIETGNLDGGGHVANTRFPFGFMTGSAATGDDATRIYFRVDDIGAYADRVVELGGLVLNRNDYPSGGNVECVDDQGYRFDLWKPAPGY